MADTVGNCLNCDAVINWQDKFCNNCGQRNKSSRITIKELFNDFLSDYFTFDSKLFRSIFPLLFKPGFLTKEYINGRRIKYIPPLRMYIFISIIYFFIISLNAESIIPKPELADSDKPGNKVTISLGNKNIPGSMIEKAYYDKNEDILLDTLDWEKNAINITLVKLFAQQYVRLESNPQNFAPQVLKIASIMMFFIMPVFALLLMLFYFQKRNYYIDHLIFSFHFHSFLFILLMVLYLAIEVAPALSITIAVLVIIYYLYRALRNVYNQKRMKTIFKMTALLSAGFVILFFTFLATIMVSFMLF